MWGISWVLCLHDLLPFGPTDQLCQNMRSWAYSLFILDIGTNLKSIESVTHPSQQCTVCKVVPMLRYFLITAEDFLDLNLQSWLTSIKGRGKIQNDFLNYELWKNRINALSVQKGADSEVFLASGVLRRFQGFTMDCCFSWQRDVQLTNWVGTPILHSCYQVYLHWLGAPYWVGTPILHPCYQVYMHRLGTAKRCNRN